MSPKKKKKKCAPVKYQFAALNEANSTPAVSIKKDTRVTESRSGLLKRIIEDEL